MAAFISRPDRWYRAPQRTVLEQRLSRDCGGGIGSEACGPNGRAPGTEAQAAQLGTGVDAARGAARLKERTQLLHGPIAGAVGGVLEELADDLAPNSGVGAALDVDDGRDRVLIDEEVVEAPATSRACLVGDPDLPGEQDPPPRRLSDIVAVKQPRMVGQHGLQHVLGLVGALGQGDRGFAPASEVDAAHGPRSASRKLLPVVAA